MNEYHLFVAVAATVSISFICSLTEAALYAVPLAHVRHIADSGSISGVRLLKLKEAISKPIAAILILNTIANTAGASLAGAIVSDVYGDSSLVIFSIFFTLLILYASEIIPKQIGVTYSRQVAPLTAFPLSLLIRFLSPLIVISEFMARAIQGKNNESRISQEEVVSMAEIGTEEGVLHSLEGSIIRNLVGLDKMTVADIMTPRVVVFRLEDSTKLSEVEEHLKSCQYSRVPIYSEQEPDFLTRYVTQRDIYRELLHGNGEMPVSELGRPMRVIPQYMRLDTLIVEMLREGEHICSVANEHGGFGGIVTLEDLIEEVVGKEIVDEYDEIQDMRQHARDISRHLREPDGE
ncbi:MAG: hemolysin family protein [bacterium]|nr:hemolysin family protein [bacterium]